MCRVTHRHTLQSVELLVLGVQSDRHTLQSVELLVLVFRATDKHTLQSVQVLVLGVQSDTQTHITVSTVVGTGCAERQTDTYCSEYSCWYWVFRATHRHTLQSVQLLVLGVLSDTQTHITISTAVGTGVQSDT